MSTTNDPLAALRALLDCCDELLRLPTAGAYPDGPCLTREDHNELAQRVVDARAAFAALTPPVHGDGPVAWALRSPTGELGALGWQPMRVQLPGGMEISPGWRIVYAYEPALHPTEARATPADGWNDTPAPRDGRRFFAQVQGADEPVFMQWLSGMFCAIDEPLNSVTGRRIVRWHDAPRLPAMQSNSTDQETAR